jgi:uncharacterized protein
MTILASIRWRRIDAPGHDDCRLEETASGWRLYGVAVFQHESGPAELSYNVHCRRDWITESGEVRGVVGDRAIDILIERSDGAWRLNGEGTPGLDHLLDLDLSFTPATNLLQLKRVPLPLGEAVALPAAWFNLETGALTELRQIYERRSAHALRYRAPDVGYEGVLELAPNGFVLRYPGLWEAVEAVKDL